jgi:methylenetetrahydrofolate reductase (NADPH)
MDRLSRLSPVFVDVTWGAGGRSSDLSLRLASTVQQSIGLNTLLHLTCVGLSRDQTRYVLNECKKHGIRNILALRGDPPVEGTPVEGDFLHAIDLVKFIKEEFGDSFCIAVAGYPEKHIEATSWEDDLRHCAEKVAAGANMILTQLFYDPAVFFNYVKELRARGVTVPIIPGIMPILGAVRWRAFAGVSDAVLGSLTNSLSLFPLCRNRCAP